MMKKLLLVLLPLFYGTFSKAQLTKKEKQLVAYVNQHMNEAKQLLIESVNINSGTLNKDGVRKVGAVYRREFDKLGFTTEWVNLPDSLNRAGHLVATRKGKKGKRIFLI